MGIGRDRAILSGVHGRSVELADSRARDCDRYPVATDVQPNRLARHPRRVSGIIQRDAQNRPETHRRRAKAEVRHVQRAVRA